MRSQKSLILLLFSCSNSVSSTLCLNLLLCSHLVSFSQFHLCFYLSYLSELQYHLHSYSSSSLQDFYLCLTYVPNIIYLIVVPFAIHLIFMEFVKIFRKILRIYIPHYNCLPKKIKYILLLRCNKFIF